MEDDNGMIILIFYVVSLSLFGVIRKLVLLRLMNWEVARLFGSEVQGKSLPRLRVTTRRGLFSDRSGFMGQIIKVSMYSIDGLAT
jgi:hypothetical protein